MAEQDDEFDDRSNNRPRRRDDEPPPKKKGGIVPILLMIGGVLLLGCCGIFGYAGYFLVNMTMDLMKKPNEFLAKVSQNDYANAYGMLSPRFQGQVTLEQFTTAMKNAKLDKNTGFSGTPAQSQSGNEITYTVTTGVSEGKSTSVSLKFVPESPSNPFKFILDDLTGPDIKYDGSKPKDDKPKDKPKTEDDN